MHLFSQYKDSTGWRLTRHFLVNVLCRATVSRILLSCSNDASTRPFLVSHSFDSCRSSLPAHLANPLNDVTEFSELRGLVRYLSLLFLRFFFPNAAGGRGRRWGLRFTVHVKAEKCGTVTKFILLGVILRALFDVTIKYLCWTTNIIV